MIYKDSDIIWIRNWNVYSKTFQKWTVELATICLFLRKYFFLHFLCVKSVKNDAIWFTLIDWLLGMISGHASIRKPIIHTDYGNVLIFVYCVLTECEEAGKWKLKQKYRMLCAEQWTKCIVQILYVLYYLVDCLLGPRFGSVFGWINNKQYLCVAEFASQSSAIASCL